MVHCLPSERLEIERIRKVLADAHREKCILLERKRTLVEQVVLRFRALPTEVFRAILMTQSADQLADWLRRIAAGKDIKSIGLGA